MFNQIPFFPYCRQQTAAQIYVKFNYECLSVLSLQR
jgi:hypothetical protein